MVTTTLDKSGSIFRRLGREALLVVAADSLSAVGSGMTMPFLMMYFHSVRGIPLGTAGIATSCLALAGLAGNPIGGSLSDRLGPRPILAIGLAIAGAGTVAIALAETSAHAIVSAALTGLGLAVALPAQDTLISRLVASDLRSQAFSLRHAGHNAGIAIGSLIAAMIVASGGLSHFVVLYLLDATTFLIAVPVALLAKSDSTANLSEPRSQPAEGESASGYLAVTKDRIFLALLMLIAILFAVGYAQFNSIFALYVTDSLRLDAGTVSVAFLANALTVTAVQLAVSRRVAGWRRTRAVMVLCSVWAIAWVLLLAAGSVAHTFATTLCIAYAVVFGIGETLFAPSIPPLVNDMAPGHLRGRYNGASALTCTVGFAVGPALAGFALEGGFGARILICFLVALGLAAVISWSLEKRISRQVNMIPSGNLSDCGSRE
ncbi:MFS transporter [Streptomyces sp. NPDC015127]|uniref:MFS transporter n=1 Tax=Streptomyces sp. NPDC015127 TaxID=3364939 RepID=UPI0036F50747